MTPGWPGAGAYLGGGGGRLPIMLLIWGFCDGGDMGGGGGGTWKDLEESWPAPCRWPP